MVDNAMVRTGLGDFPAQEPRGDLLESECHQPEHGMGDSRERISV